MILRRIDDDDDNDDGEGEDDGEEEEEDEEEEDDDDDGEDDDDEAATQKLGPHFVRACAVEMHVNISEESLFAVICRKNVVPQNEPRTRTHTLCEGWAVETHVKISQEPLDTEIYSPE